MADNQLGIHVPDVASLLDPKLQQAAHWPRRKRERFHAEWLRLVDAGAEWVECETYRGTIDLRLSDDFLAHCRAYGIK